MKIGSWYRTVVPILITVIITIAAGCLKNEKELIQFSSQKKLIQFIIANINDGNAKAVINSFIPSKVFIKKMYRYTDAAKSPNALSGNDFWRIFMGLKRINGVNYKINCYKGRIVSLEGIHPAKKIVDAGPYKFHRHVAVKLKILGEDGKFYIETDDDIFGVIVEYKNKYMLLNMFK